MSMKMTCLRVKTQQYQVPAILFPSTCTSLSSLEKKVHQVIRVLKEMFKCFLYLETCTNLMKSCIWCLRLWETFVFLHMLSQNWDMSTLSQWSYPSKGKDASHDIRAGKHPWTSQDFAFFCCGGSRGASPLLFSWKEENTEWRKAIKTI